jgi:predicted dehydrogenase
MAVVGCGHLGTIHARLLAARVDVELVAVVDPLPEQRARVAAAHGCRECGDPRQLAGAVDAVVVAAPTALHAEVSLPLLEAGIDLLVEKPLATTPAEARAIEAAARRRGRVVAVGHVERFNPAWRLAAGRCGPAVAVECQRLAPFTFRSLDVGAVLDLMIHDIDLVLSLAPGELVAVEARGVIACGGHEDAVRARLGFSSGLVADLAASRIHPVLRRTAALWGRSALVTADFNTRAVEVVGCSPVVAAGGFVAADVPFGDRGALKERFFTDVLPRESIVADEVNAIACEHDDFLDAVRSRGTPLVPAAAGTAALEVACRVLGAMSCVRLGAAATSVAVPLPAPPAAASALRKSA